MAKPKSLRAQLKEIIRIEGGVDFRSKRQNDLRKQINALNAERENKAMIARATRHGWQG